MPDESASTALKALFECPIMPDNARFFDCEICLAQFCCMEQLKKATERRRPMDP